jgi:hypothetical protein
MRLARCPRLGRGFFCRSFGGRQAGKLCDEDAGNLGEVGAGRFFENEGNAATPSFDKVDSAEQVGDKGIATAKFS